MTDRGYPPPHTTIITPIITGFNFLSFSTAIATATTSSTTTSTTTITITVYRRAINTRQLTICHGKG